MAGSKLISEVPEDLWGFAPSQNCAYLIKEGHCNLVSSKNPTMVKFSKEGKLVYKKNHLALFDNLNKKGYMSKTTNSFVLGSKGAG